MINLKLIVQYDGTEYHGFQYQPGLPTIQGVLQKELSRLARLDSPLYAAGRTDAGVHARGQVVSVKALPRVSPEKMPRALNALLPPDIAVVSAEEVEESFHARRSAKAREYVYHILRSSYPSPFHRRYTMHYPRSLDLGRMREALQYVVGVHDFTSFCRERGAVREVLEAGLEECGEILTIRVKANAFAWMMVRMLAGSLLEVGRGKWSVERFREVLEARDNAMSGPALPPQGLFLEKVFY